MKQFEKKDIKSIKRPWYLNNKFIFVMKVLLFPIMLIVKLFKWTYA